MRRPAIRFHARAGFTLIEIVIVIAMILILTALGISASDEMLPRFRTRKAALNFARLAQECRSIAIQTGRECSIWLLDSDADLSTPGSNAGQYWVGVGDADRDSSTWDYLPVDVGGSDIDTSQGLIDLSDSDGPHWARNVSIADWGTGISGPGTGNSDRIVFGPQGFVTNPASNFNSSGFIEITFVNKIVRSKGQVEDYTVRITRSGMVRVDPTVNDTLDGYVAGTSSSSSTP